MVPQNPVTSIFTFIQPYLYDIMVRGRTNESFRFAIKKIKILMYKSTNIQMNANAHYIYHRSFVECT